MRVFFVSFRFFFFGSFFFLSFSCWDVVLVEVVVAVVVEERFDTKYIEVYVLTPFSCVCTTIYVLHNIQWKNNSIVGFGSW